MARTLWTGSLGFGLVNVPVGVYPATKDKSIHFNQLEAGTSDRIRYRKVNERTGEEVDSADIVKGYDLGGGEYVVVTDEELEAAAPEKSRNIEITDFVDLAEIDPVYYRATYYLAPQGEAAEKAYSLLRKAMREANKVGIATWVHRNKEYLVAIRPEDEVIALETMFFADEVRSATDELPALPPDPKLTAKELKTAELLIGSMASEWEPDRYEDTHRNRVRELIERKSAGETITVESVPTRATKVVDLMAALQASVDARSTGSSKNQPSGNRTRTATAAKASRSGRGASSGSKAKRASSDGSGPKRAVGKGASASKTPARSPKAPGGTKRAAPAASQRATRQRKAS